MTWWMLATGVLCAVIGGATQEKRESVRWFAGAVAWGVMAVVLKFIE